MSAWLRLGGSGRPDRDDDIVVWSLAEGARGRRWRWIRQVYQGFLDRAGMIEFDPDGRLRRFELSSFGGLLTFHPDADGLSAHGNIVSADRVAPIESVWRPDWGIGIVGDPFGSAIGGWSGSGFVVSFHGDGLVWRAPGVHPDVTALSCDDRGVPVLSGAREWPLEA